MSTRLTYTSGDMTRAAEEFEVRLAEARAGSADPQAVDLITTYADGMEANDGYTRPKASFVDGERNTDVLRPYGTFAVIAPFNLPAALAVTWPVQL